MAIGKWLQKHTSELDSLGSMGFNAPTMHSLGPRTSRFSLPTYYHLPQPCRQALPMLLVTVFLVSVTCRTTWNL